MRNVHIPMILVATLASACAANETQLGNALDESEPAFDAAIDAEQPPIQANSAAVPSSSVLTQAEIDLLNDLGLGLGDDPGAYDYGFGQVVVTPASGTPIVMEGVAIQLWSADRFWDNTLLYAWAGLDVSAGTADHLLRFRAAGYAEPAVVPLDAQSNFMLPSWIIFSDAAADATYYNEDGTLEIEAVTLDPATEVDCTAIYEDARCTTGDLEGENDMSTLGYDGFGVGYLGPDDRGTSTSTLDVTVTFDVPVQRASIAR